LAQEGKITQLYDSISKSVELLSKNVGSLDDVRPMFTMQEHSLGILAILVAKYSVSPLTNFDTLITQTCEFITSCNGEHVRYATDMFADLCHKFTQALVEKKQPMKGIAWLCRAITKIQLHSSQLTSIHADLCKLCLTSKCLKPAVQFLDVDVTEISKEGGQFDSKYFLLYYYYGGMIYLALKNYKRAFFFFEIAVTTPSMAVSHIMLEAYKKYILVSLILHGKSSSMPRYTSHIVSRYIKPLCQPYHELAAAYNVCNSTELNALVTRHAEVFARDRNQGLVRQCVVAMYKKNIKRLTKTFMTLSLTDMANRVQLSGPREAEKYVLAMIEDGEIFATVNQRDGMVSFHDNPEKYNGIAMLTQLDEEMKRCMELEEKLKTMEREVTVNPQYVQKSLGMHDEDAPMSSMKFPVGHM
jgi:COP9 signalosome complex subunit 3